jgi:hypothetical protein
MQTVNCPGCGAEVRFRSSAAVMAVCEYCHSTLLREADQVRDIGKMSAVLEDYSPLQIGTSGIWPNDGKGRASRWLAVSSCGTTPVSGANGMCCSTTARTAGWRCVGPVHVHAQGA